MKHNRLISLILITLIYITYYTYIARYKYQKKTENLFLPVFGANLCISCIFIISMCIIKYNIFVLYSIYYLSVLFIVCIQFPIPEKIFALLSAVHVSYTLLQIKRQISLLPENTNKVSLYLHIATTQTSIKNGCISLLKNSILIVPLLTIFTCLLYVQIFLFSGIHVLDEKYWTISCIVILLLNLYNALCMKILKQIINKTAANGEQINLSGILIVFMSGVYTFNSSYYILNRVMVLVGYCHMMLLNRIYSYSDITGLIKLSIMVYSPSVLFSWIMGCIYLYSAKDMLVT